MGRLHLFLVALCLAACGDDDGSGPAPPPALEITARTPAPSATGVETGATVTVTFNQAIDPASLTPATFRVKLGAMVLARGMSYDVATHTATATAPLVPGATYDVEMTTGVRTPAGSALGAPGEWSFTTRVWQAVTLAATGDVGLDNALAVDGAGHVHVTYYDTSNDDLKYATCAAACAAAANWQTATVDAAGVVGFHTSLAVDDNGRVHVSYVNGSSLDLKYIE